MDFHDHLSQKSTMTLEGLDCVAVGVVGAFPKRQAARWLDAGTFLWPLPPLSLLVFVEEQSTVNITDQSVTNRQTCKLGTFLTLTMLDYFDLCFWEM